MVKWLLAKGADVNVAAPSVAGTLFWQSYTPLMWACLYGHTEVADKLLKAGADTQHRGRDFVYDVDGHRRDEVGAFNAIEIARIKGYEEIASLIINAKKTRVAPQLKALSLTDLLEKSSLNDEAYVLALTDAFVVVKNTKLQKFLLTETLNQKTELESAIESRLLQSQMKIEQCKNEAEICLGQDNGAKAVELRNLSVAIMGYQSALKAIKAELEQENSF